MIAAMSRTRSTRQAPRRRSTPAEEAVIGVLRTADAFRRRLAAVFEPHDLTSQQYNVLRILRGARPEALPTMEIAERMMEKTPGITRLIDRLEAKGLVERQRGSDDRRCVRCAITPPGLELLARLDEPVTRADEELVAALSREEARRLVALLDRVRAAGE